MNILNSFFGRILSNKSKRELKIFKSLFGNEVINIFDVGARGGLNKRWFWIKEYINVIGFEPDPSECYKLNSETNRYSPQITFLPHALGRAAKSNKKFFICKSPGNSSFLEPNSDFIKDFCYAESGAMNISEITQMDVTTLSQVCASEKIRPDYLKIDTQGSELDILVGGENILGSVKLLELEVEFNPQYKNQAIFSDVDLYLRKFGFMLLGIRRTLWRRKNCFDNCISAYGGQLIHGDALFINSNFVKSSIKISQIDMLKLLLLLSAYRQHDFVLNLLSSPHPSLKNIDESVRLQLAKEIVPEPGMMLKMLGKINSFFNHKSLRNSLDKTRNHHAIDWHDPDFF